MENKITALIPVREQTGFETLSKKDFLPFAGTNLLTHKIRQLKELKDIDIVVSTESDYLYELAVKENVKVIKRPGLYANTNTPFRDFVKYICQQLSTEHILWACVTSPLVEATHYKKAIELYIQKLNQGFDSLVSVQKLQRYLMDSNGALNFRPGKKFKTIDQLPLLYIFTNGISIAPRNCMIEWGYTSGEIPYMYELGKKESIDICDEFDYECAKFFYEGINE